MDAVDIGLGDRQVFAHHVHGGMAEHHLQRPGIAAVAEIRYRKSMSEAVRVDIGDFGAIANAIEELKQAVASEWVAVRGSEKRFVELRLPAQGQVAPKRLAGASAKGQVPLFAEFSEDGDAPVFGVYLVDQGAAELAGAHAGIEQKVDDRPVTFVVGDGMGAGALAGPAVGAGGLEHGEQGLDILLSEWDNGLLLRGWASHLVQDVFLHKIFTGRPGPQSRQSGMVIQDGFLLDGGLRGEETFHLAVVDIGQGRVSDEVDKLLEGIAVICQGMFRQMAGLGGEFEAADSLGEGKLVFGFWFHPLGLR